MGETNNCSHNASIDTKSRLLISLHIRSMWETICDAWACWSGWKFDPNSTEYPYSAIQNTRPPPRKWKLSEILALWLFSCRIPPPPKKNLKFRQILALCQFSVAEYPPPPPRKLKFRQILALCEFSVAEYPPSENWNLGRSWHFVSFQLQNTPPPPKKLKFRQIFPMGNYVWQVTTCGDFIQPG